MNEKCAYINQNFAPQCVSAVWWAIAGHGEGLRTCEVAEWTRLSRNVAAAIIEELHVGGHVYFDRHTGRWRVGTELD